MRELEFERFLVESVDIQSKKKAVISRVTKALKVERDLKVNLDNIVTDDEVDQECSTSTYTPNTILQKVISVGDIDNYLRDIDPYTTIGGYIAKA